MQNSKKYNRSLHAHISLGSTSDDRFMPNGYVEAFANMKRLVLTEKLDGQNNCFTKQGLFARSHTSPSNLPWDKPMRERWNLLKNDLGDYEIFGENMYGIHSIAYEKLASYFYVFAVRVKDTWLSWEEVQSIAMHFEFPTVPEIIIEKNLSDIFENSKNENAILAQWFKENLGMSWEASVNTSGLLGGYNPLTQQPASEGFVVRNANEFKSNDGILKVAPNEFNNLFKVVREGHVQTDEHWTKNWKPAKLAEYYKHGWYGYAHLSR
ncbi:MAG: FIG00850486: hypothetical protein [uncultured Sulfurovum sp.]|uniref:RNA ligase domain-containing protein n=1 Tax=uncultured Sulfurovum sp. TaxID=269237 RepID=A0A6S6TQ29_9BACT|nr:MAG: FIG00850486: hypothetical protein [uncultured Sulfurovum sp.]